MFLSSGAKRENSKLNLCLDFIGLRMTYLQFRGDDFMLPFQSVDYGEGVRKKRGSHFCVPIFGKAPASSALNGKIPQHGFLRDMRVSLDRINGSESRAQATFHIRQSEEYPWAIMGRVYFYCTNNTLKINMTLSRPWNCSGNGLAPVNPGFHPYWIDRDGIFVSTTGFNEKLNEIVNPSQHLPYLGPVEVKLCGIGTVKMEMDGDIKDPEIVMWSDHQMFKCVELVAGNTKNFDTPKGIFLDKGKDINVTFLLTFSGQE